MISQCNKDPVLLRLDKTPYLFHIEIQLVLQQISPRILLFVSLRKYNPLISIGHSRVEHNVRDGVGNVDARETIPSPFFEIDNDNHNDNDNNNEIDNDNGHLCMFGH